VFVEGNFHGEPENPLNFEPFGEPPSGLLTHPANGRLNLQRPK